MSLILYHVWSYQSDKELFNTIHPEDLYDYEHSDDYYITTSIGCKLCQQPSVERFDAYGIYTGCYCDKCYDSPQYPYRKDRYPTQEYHGYGERLNEY